MNHASDSMLYLLVGIGLLIAFLNLLVSVWVWHRYDNLSARVTRLEVKVDLAVKSGDVAAMREDIATLKGRVDVAVHLMQSIQHHLIEDEE